MFIHTTEETLEFEIPWRKKHPLVMKKNQNKTQVRAQSSTHPYCVNKSYLISQPQLNCPSQFFTEHRQVFSAEPRHNVLPKESLSLKEKKIVFFFLRHFIFGWFVTHRKRLSVKIEFYRRNILLPNNLLFTHISSKTQY